MRGQRSLRRSLALHVISATSIALAATSGSLFAYDVIAFRTEMIEHVSILAAVIGSNSVDSLAFGDTNSAQETLTALGADRHVIAAQLYTLEGRPFAAYARDVDPAAFSFPAATQEGEWLRWDRLRLLRQVRVDGEPVASLYLEFDTDALIARLALHAEIALAALVGSALLALAIAAHLQRRIAKPLAELAVASRALAAGDLRGAVPRPAIHELAVLADAFAEMGQGLRDLVRRVRENTSSVAAVVASVRDTGTEMVRDTRTQTGAVREIATSVQGVTRTLAGIENAVDALSAEAGETSSSVTELDAALSGLSGHADSLSETTERTAASSSQLNRSIATIGGSIGTLEQAARKSADSVEALRVAADRVMELTGDSRDAADRTREAARVGAGSVAETARGMEEIRNGFSDIERIVGELSRQSVAIGDVVALIDEVSDETDLLALNAEIIAAQAGEHGRAFSVVAQEVKGLATRTAASARDIAALIKSVRAETAGAVSAVARGATLVEKGVARTAEAATALRRIDESAVESTATTQAIIDAAASQVTGFAQVEQASAHVRDAARAIRDEIGLQVAASSEIAQAAGAARELGAEVRGSVHEQRGASGAIARAAFTTRERVEEIVGSIRQLTAASERIARALATVNEAAGAGQGRAEGLGRVVEDLAGRSDHLERELARFRV